MPTTPEKAIARIFTADGTVVGTGFLVNAQQVMTCAHVVNSALGKPRGQADQPADPVTLDFPLVDGGPENYIAAQVIRWQPMNAGDIAVLELQDTPPGEAHPVTFGSTAGDMWGKECRTFGFFSPGGDAATGRTLTRQADGWLTFEAAPGSQYFVEPGFSGAPAWDISGHVLGMVVTKDGRDGVRVAFLIPAERLMPSETAAPTREHSPLVDVVLAHCRRVADDVRNRDWWGLDHYIQSDARLLPIHASPYEDGGIRGNPENLLHRLHRSRRLIVLGESGMGKTVALERLAWELATGEPPVVPVFIRLFEYDGQPLLEWVYLNLRSYDEIDHQSSKDTHAFLMDKDQPYHCYFLLDGLNEVRPEHRNKVLDEIRILAKEYPRHPLVVTSRVQDDGWKYLRQGNALHETVLVQAIRPDQAQDYLNAHLGTDDGRLLWGQLNPPMCELATTPLLLWFIKEAWLEAREQQGEGPIRMPDNRGALYRSFVSRLLKRDDERRLTEQVPEDVRLSALEKLARVMHREKSLTISRSTALAVIDSQTTLDALLVNGLLVPVGADLLRFGPHQTMQEHFAARAIQRDVMRKVQTPAFLRRIWRGVLRYADDSWWAETFIQLAGLADNPNALARALAGVNPWLAWWCVQEGHQVDETTRKVIRARSEALVRSDNVQDRRRAAETLARLKTPRVLKPLVTLSLDADATIIHTALQAVLTFGDMGEQAFSAEFAKKLPKERAVWGRSIADIDPRPGVGLRPDGFLDIEWVEIPAGEFIFGNEFEGNGPQKLTLPTFYIARYLVTHRQFQAFIDTEDGFHNPQWWEGLVADDDHKAAPGEQAFKYWNHPRENVSWWDAVAFCCWLSAKLGYEVWLPTEQQWEKAARGTDGREYPWDGEYISGYANVNEVGSEAGPYSLGQTTAVGIYPQGASPYGVLDMSGNVWEWCLNEYSNPEKTGSGSSSARVVRGGAWDFNWNFARGAYRNDWWPYYRVDFGGFRVVCARPMP